MKKIEFNMNKYVHVKLTERGDQILEHQYLDFKKLYPNVEFQRERIEDDEGYSKWQLWELMSIFGEYCGNGRPNPFELKIYFEQEVEEEEDRSDFEQYDFYVKNGRGIDIEERVWLRKNLDSDDVKYELEDWCEKVFPRFHYTEAMTEYGSGKVEE